MQPIKQIEIANDILFEEVRQLLVAGHSVTMRVKGQSMRPLLEGGRDKVTLASVGVLKTGDLVLAEVNKGHFVLHRIIKMQGNCITLMGDGNIIGIETCNKEDVRGVVIAIERNEKRWNATDPQWKQYSRLWVEMKPMRRYLLAIYNRIKKP